MYTVSEDNVLLTITLSLSDIAAPFLTESGFFLSDNVLLTISLSLSVIASPLLTESGFCQLAGLGTGAGPGAGSAELDPGRGKPGTSSGELDLGAGELGACDGGSTGGRLRTSSMTLFPKKTV